MKLIVQQTISVMKLAVVCWLFLLSFPAFGANRRLPAIDFAVFLSDNFIGSINDAGAAVWLKICPSYEEWPGKAIYVNEGGGRVRIATEFETGYLGFSTPRINNNGVVAFVLSGGISRVKNGNRDLIVDRDNLPSDIDLLFVESLCSLDDDERVTFAGPRRSNGDLTDYFGAQNGLIQRIRSGGCPPHAPVPAPVEVGEVIDFVSSSGVLYIDSIITSVFAFQINARGQVLMSLTHSNKYSTAKSKTLVLTDPATFDLKVDSLKWNPTTGGVDFAVAVEPGTLPTATSAKLYWSKGTTTGDILSSTPIYTLALPAGFGGSTPTISLPPANFQNPPAGTTHVLLQLDPDNVLAEPKNNNTAFIPEVVFGIDVNGARGAIDWTLVHNAGKAFAFVKATEGRTFTDSRFTILNDIQTARANGILMGVYHFARPLNNSGTEGAIAEAKHFLSVAGPYIGGEYLPPVLDIENDPDGVNYPNDPCLDGTEVDLVCKLGKHSLSAWVRAWIAQVYCATGVRPIIYTTRGYAKNGMESDLSPYPLWIADYTGQQPTATPAFQGSSWPDWTFKQYSDIGTCDGVAGAVDLDSFHGDLSALLALVSQTGALNNSPTFSGYSFKTTVNARTTVANSKILARASDPDGNPIAIISVSNTSTQGGAVALDTDVVIYTPPDGFIGTDSFSVTISDCRGSRVTGTVTASVTATTPSGSSGNGANLATITAGAGGITLTFYGIPGQSYDIQRSSNLSTWTTIGTVNATTIGKIQYTDSAPLSSAYYRTSTAQ